LQLLEEACAYEACWFSDLDEYDGSDCDRGGKSEALVYYKDIVAHQRQMDVDASGANDSLSEMKLNSAEYSGMNTFNNATNQLDASLCEQLPSSPQIPFEVDLPLPKERRQKAAFATGPALPTMIPLVLKREVSNANQISYDREVYSSPNFPQPPPTSLSENFTEQSHFDVQLELKPSDKVTQNMEAKGGINNDLLRPEFYSSLYRSLPPTSGKQSRSSTILTPTTLSCRPYPPSPPTFLTRNRHNTPMVESLSPTLEETQMYSMTTHETNDLENEKLRAYGYRDLLTTSNKQYNSIHPLPPPSEKFEEELQTGDTRKTYLPLPKPLSNILPKEDPNFFSFRPPPPPTFP